MPQLKPTRYPEELSRFLAARAAQLDAQPAESVNSPFDAIQKARMNEGAPLMPPEFQLTHPRRVRWSGWFNQPDGSKMHFSGFRDATPEQEMWHRIHAPERGLHPDDLLAYRESKRGLPAKLFTRLKCGSAKKY